MSLTLTHARYQFVETLRIPVAVIATVFFPAASMLFFVVPNAADDPRAATVATASMVVFATMVTCLFQYGSGVAEDRALPWESFVRTLPTGAGPRFAARVLVGTAFVLVAVVPVVLIAVLFTEATLTPARFLAALGGLVVAVVPFTLLGLAIGYSLPAKAATAVATISFLPLAFGGGLMGDPEDLPGFIDTIAPFLPTRGAAELIWAAVSDFTVDPLSMVMLAVWTVAAGGAAVFAYRRDEGRRFS
ncbi:ABC transporter permease [Jiangella endophytica]|uniref:ABC transporter permease n=1 Tax=Jiangella endophytica TaxID=1623398 RepID=UPI000E343E3F|nr:ABC transporter permease [Jiangella endophytica]